MANCDGVKPAGVPVEGHVPAIGGLLLAADRAFRASGTDPSLNVDTSRNGVEPDIAFTGTNDGVPVDRVVREGSRAGKGSTTTKWSSPPRASKTAKPRTAASTGSPSASALSGTLDTSGTNQLGPCGESRAAEARCSLNKDTNGDAENPRVATRHDEPRQPHLALDHLGRGVGGVKRSSSRTSSAAAPKRTSNSPTAARRSRPGPGDATRPDITFSGNTPYVSWRQEVEGRRAFTGHFVEPRPRSCSTRAT